MSSSTYVVSDADREAFKRDGFVHLKGVLTNEEVASLEPVYDRYLRGEIPVPGKDMCDMGGREAGPDITTYSVPNIMLPRKYYPEWKGNVYERRTQDIVRQLLQRDDMRLDYDQLLAKHPQREDAIFAWHQDSAYWPPFTSDKSTATCWLAIDPSTKENGCMRFVIGSTHEPQLRKHRPFGGDGGRKKHHALVTDVDGAVDRIHYAELQRGDITIHDERVVHGSGPNRSSSSWRRAYIVAYRTVACIAEERKVGFDHSHNSEVNWDDWDLSGNPHVAAARESRE